MKRKTIVRVTVTVMAAAAISVFGLYAANSSPQMTDAAVSGITVAAEATEQAAGNEKAEPKESAEAGKRIEQTDSGDSRKAEPQAEKKAKTATVNQNVASDKPLGQEPAHTHEWEEVYETAEQKIYGDRCKGCSYGTNEAGKMYEHIDADPFDGCGSYATGVVIRTEQASIFAGYKCVCGATKK